MVWGLSSAKGICSGLKKMYVFNHPCQSSIGSIGSLVFNHPCQSSIGSIGSLASFKLRQSKFHEFLNFPEQFELHFHSKYSTTYLCSFVMTNLKF